MSEVSECTTSDASTVLLVTLHPLRQEWEAKRVRKNADLDRESREKRLLQRSEAQSGNTVSGRSSGTYRLQRWVSGIVAIPNRSSQLY